MENWKKFEDRYFGINCYDGDEENQHILKYTNSSVVLVSTHGVNHYNKENKDKVADLFTGGLSLTLQEDLQTCCFVKHIKITID